MMLHGKISSIFFMVYYVHDLLSLIYWYQAVLT